MDCITSAVHGHQDSNYAVQGGQDSQPGPPKAFMGPGATERNGAPDDVIMTASWIYKVKSK